MATPPAAPPGPIDPTPPSPAAPAELGVPATLAADLTALLASDDKRARKRAADHVLGFSPKESVPVHLRNLAWLEKAGSCANKREVIEQMESAGDARVLPALRRLAATRRRGCGFFNSQDCLACLRETLARAIGRLNTGAASAPEPSP